MFGERKTSTLPRTTYRKCKKNLVVFLSESLLPSFPFSIHGVKIRNHKLSAVNAYARFLTVLLKLAVHYFS